MSLDKRLKELRVPTSIRYDVDGTSEVKSWVHLGKSSIEAIKQAFIDEGWVQVPQVEVVTRYEAGKKPEVYMVNGKEVMTGPEWLARFEKETAGQLFPYRNDREQELVASTAHFFNQAARRATGVDHD